MLDPTEALLQIANETGARFTFFPDVAWLLKQPDQRVIDQMLKWQQMGHETGLHIHPHWEDCQATESGWNMDLTRYKLSDFAREDAHRLILKYANGLNDIMGKRAISFRAGGWCVQPFTHIHHALYEAGIRIDSSVFKGGQNLTPPYNYNFASCPEQEAWNFDTDPCTPDNQGRFTELPIASMLYSPLFFWQLFVRGRLNKRQHKPIGNGFPAAGGGSKKQLLTTSNLLCVSADGYFATKIPNAIARAEKLGHRHLVIIGHPKACTRFSLKHIAQIIHHQKSHQFVPLSQLVDD
jgi:hypothetical protein